MNQDAPTADGCVRVMQAGNKIQNKYEMLVFRVQSDLQRRCVQYQYEINLHIVSHTERDGFETRTAERRERRIQLKLFIVSIKQVSLSFTHSLTYIPRNLNLRYDHHEPTILSTRTK